MKPFAFTLPLAAAGLAGVAAAQQPAAAPPAPIQAPSVQPAPATPAQQTAAPQPQNQPNGAPDATQSANAPAPPAGAANPFPGASLATVSLDGVSLSGSLSVEDGRASIGNNGAITAGERTAHVSLTRGGSLNVCASTKIHLSTDNTVSGGGLMIAIDRGALEARYLPGAYSDVVLTPDLRILISGPGQADLSLRVNSEGDTCVDNHGDHAPYVLASSLFEGGAYRVQPNQRVLFEHGGLQQIVDNEKEPCGCPPPPPTPQPTSIAKVGLPGGTLHTSDQSATPPPPSATTASTAAQNPFPLAESEGLQPPPPPPTNPVVPPGEAHAQVTAPLVYNGETAQNVGMPASSLSAPAPAPGSSPAAIAPKPACNDPLYPGVVCDSANSAVQPPPPAANPANAASAPAAPNPKPRKKSGFIHFLRRIFSGS